MKRFLPLFFVMCSNGPAEMPDAGVDAAGPTPIVELRADTNRNGTIDWADPTEVANKDTWDAKHGAIFLANIDDDLAACNKSGTDVTLAQCHDAADTVINGDTDLLDLAPLATKPWPDAPEGTTGTLSVSMPADGFVHLFKKTERSEERRVGKECKTRWTARS